MSQGSLPCDLYAPLPNDLTEVCQDCCWPLAGLTRPVNPQAWPGKTHTPSSGHEESCPHQQGLPIHDRGACGHGDQGALRLSSLSPPRPTCRIMSLKLLWYCLRRNPGVHGSCSNPNWPCNGTRSSRSPLRKPRRPQMAPSVPCSCMMDMAGSTSICFEVSSLN